MERCNPQRCREADSPFSSLLIVGFPHTNKTVLFTAVAPGPTTAPATGRRATHMCGTSKRVTSPMPRTGRGRTARAARPGPRQPPGLARTRRRAVLPRPLLNPPPGGAPSERRRTSKRGPQGPRPQKPSPLGVSRTLLPERRWPSLIGEQVSAPGKKRSPYWPSRLRNWGRGGVPKPAGGSAPSEGTSAGNPFPRAREVGRSSGGTRRGSAFLLTWPSRELSDGSHRTNSSRVATREPVPCCEADSSPVKTELTHSGPGIRMKGGMYLKPQPRATPFLHVST